MEELCELRCDTCFTSSKHVPIVEKPARYSYKTEVILLDNKNMEGKAVDIICLDCLKEEIERSMTDWF